MCLSADLIWNDRGNNIIAIDVEGQGSLTIQEVQDCMEAGYRGLDSNENTST